MTKVGEGVFGRKGTRNTPSILNAAFNDFQFWDGRVNTLEEQAKHPLVNSMEMGMKNHYAVVTVIAKDSSYISDFKTAFGHGPTIADVVAALTNFERVVLP